MGCILGELSLWDLGGVLNGFSFVRSVSMDTWSEDQIKRMQVSSIVDYHKVGVADCKQIGGNKPFKEFMWSYTPAEQGGYTEGMDPHAAYHSWAATQYRSKVRTLPLLHAMRLTEVSAGRRPRGETMVSLCTPTRYPLSPRPPLLRARPAQIARVQPRGHRELFAEQLRLACLLLQPKPRHPRPKNGERVLLRAARLRQLFPP